MLQFYILNVYLGFPKTYPGPGTPRDLGTFKGILSITKMIMLKSAFQLFLTHSSDCLKSTQDLALLETEVLLKESYP